jgi:SAM-dependent methyltransferase
MASTRSARSLEQLPHRASIFDAWAKYYDLIEGDRTTISTFYCNLISRDTRSIVELACGTGTITLALAQRLVECSSDREALRVVGVDESAAMLRIARAKDPWPQWLLGDIRVPPVDGVFDLAICCYNTVQLLLTDADLAAFFDTVRAMLDTDGIFAFDVYQPNLPYLANSLKDRLIRSVTDDDGRRLELREGFCYDAGSRILHIQLRVVDPASPAADPLVRLNFEMRQYFAGEIARALAMAGFTIRRRYGDFDGSAFRSTSKKQIVICAPARSRASGRRR